MARIYGGRHACLKADEQPRDLLISIDLKYQLIEEAGMRYTETEEGAQVMGMKIEWLRPGDHDISIRTKYGDVRIVPPRVTKERKP